MTTATGKYRQTCYNCNQPTGHTDDVTEIEILGSCCADLPPIWDMGANGLYGTDAGVGRRDREGYILEFGDDAYDDDEYCRDDCECYNCRFDHAELAADEVHELDDYSLGNYNERRSARGLDPIIR